jgi:Protein of unknown function (DUF1036)
MGTGRDEVSFINSYGRKMFVAYMRREFACLGEFAAGGPWEIRGWITLDPGETEYRANETENRWFYYYAEADDGATWSGPHVAMVSDAKFHRCVGEGVSTGGHGGLFDVGMRELDTKTYPGVNFIP